MSVSFYRRQRRRLARKWRLAARRDINYRIGKENLILPAGHLLPYYLEDFPLYDRYFLKFFQHLSESLPGLCVIDIGANVGDTALSILSVAPDLQVVCVEGSEYFLKYLRKNVSSKSNVRLLEGFVTHRPGHWSLLSDGTTGHLVEDSNWRGPASKEPKYFTPTEVLAIAGDAPTRIWKTDTDGYDIPLLSGWFEEITKACDVMWIEFDPVDSFATPEEVRFLLKQIRGLTYDLVIFDNFGHRLLRMPCREAVTLLSQLNEWLMIQASVGSRRVHYLDLWILPSALADLLCETSTK